jgi:hypothetical protein
MLRNIYAEHRWVPWKFKFLPRHIDKDPSVLKEALEYIEAQRKINKEEEWYRISKKELKELGVDTFIEQVGGLYEVLKKYRSDLPWDKSKFHWDRIKIKRNG